MRKYLLALLFSTSLFATVSLDIGAASVDMDSKSSSGNIYMSYNAVTNIKKDHGVIMGVGIDFLTYDIAQVRRSTDEFAYVLSPQIMLGYKYKQLQVLAAVGYGVHYIETKTYWGPSFDVMVELEVYKWFGVGYKHKEWSNSYYEGLDSGSADIFYIKASF